MVEQPGRFRNIAFSRPLNLAGLVDYQEGTVVSRTLAQGKNVSITLFAFARGEEVSANTSPGDALVYVLEGEAEITIGEEKMKVKTGEAVVMPAGIPHALYAEKSFKMLLAVVFNP